MKKSDHICKIASVLPTRVSLSVKHFMAVFASVCLAMSAWCDEDNDYWASAVQIIGSGNGVVMGNNTSATTEVGEPETTKSHSLWWKWKAPTDVAKVAFHTYGSDFDAVLGVYTGEVVNAMVPIASNDDHDRWGGVNRESAEYAGLVSFDVTPGATYYICVGGKDENAHGNIRLGWCISEGFSLVTCDNGKTLLGFIGECQGSLTIPETITRIEQSAFDRDCDASVTNLESVVIPQSVTNIGLYAFCKCSNLSTVTYKGDEKNIAMDPYWVFFETPFFVNSIDNDDSGETPETPQESTVTLDLGDGTEAGSVKVTYGAKVGDITVPTRANYKFIGWFTSPTGGTRVSDDTVIASGMKLYARWEAVIDDGGDSGDDEIEVFYLYENVVGAVPATAATVYDGYLYKDNDCVGTIQVKVGKPNKKSGLATAKATVVDLKGKKKTIKAAEKGKVLIVGDGPTSITLVGGEACEVMIGTYGMKGKYGNYDIDGARNVFSSKINADKAMAAAVLNHWKGAVNMAWKGSGGWNGVSCSIANKGKATITGTLCNGAKVSAKSQLIIGEKWCCVPALVTKKMNMAFILWLPRNGQGSGSIGVVGIEGGIVGKPGSLKSNAAFRIDEDEFTAMWGKSALSYLPNGVSVNVDKKNKNKWVLPKAGKVVYVRNSTEVDQTKLLDNPSALKLTYTAKSGTFKGSFKAYAEVKGKPKATTVNVTGILVEGVGYGTAAIKKVGSVPVEVK